MWVSEKVVDWFQISKDSVDNLREELAAVKAERDVNKSELQSLRIQSDWLRMQVNTLQFERTALMDKAYGIKVPTPEIARVPPKIDRGEISFEDMGDTLAKKFGLPVYGDTN